MDIWIVAAAAGAGYVAQHFKDLTRGRQRISGSSSESSNYVKPKSSPLIRQIQDKNCPFRRLVQRKNIGKDVSKEREPVSHGTLTTEMASTSEFNGEKLLMLDNYVDVNVISPSSLSPEFLSGHGLQGDWEGVRVSGDICQSSGDLLLKPSTGELGCSYGSARDRSFLRSRRINGQLIKPLSSLESCVMGQLYKEHAQMEEYMLSSIPSPSPPIVRPFLVTDESRIISKASGDSLSVRSRSGQNKLDRNTYSEEKETVFGVPPLPNFGSTNILRKTKIKTRKERGGRLSSSSKMVATKNSNSQDSGASHGALIFSLGISFGIISSFLANRREVDKLNELLKQTENLVQDLQEELEMKDSLTVKELAVEDYESQDTHEDFCNNEAPEAFFPEQYLNESTKYDHKEFHDQKAEQESLHKIEAELETELARLEQNMNSYSLEGEMSDRVERDPDLLPEIVQGELRADMFGRQADAQPDADRDGSGGSTPDSANHAVSPRELSLRLHKVLQSRLEERINELETALQESQTKVQYTEPVHTESWRESKSGSSSTQESPIKEELNSADQPVVINLSGKALDAYNEAYNEFTKMNELEEDNKESLRPFDQHSWWGRNGGAHYMTRNGNASMAFVYQEGENHNTSSNDIGTSGDENDDDEMERLLIKQILEKTRKGSPAVLKAQRTLFSMDESEH